MDSHAPHSRRRQYPTQQYDFNAAQAAGGAPGGAPGQQPGYGGYPDVNGATAAMGNLQMAGAGYTGAPAAPLPGQPPVPAPDAYGYQYSTGAMPPSPAIGSMGAHAGGAYPGANTVPANVRGNNMTAGMQLPLNELYTVDLMKSLPPPISELDLDPPPLVLPQNLGISGNKDEANASPEYMRCTLNAVPNTKGLLNKSKLPFALVIRPSAALLDVNENIPVVEDAVVTRCRRCRTYINPFVDLYEDGTRWRCNICQLLNDVPSRFDWDPNQNVRKDRYARNELNYGIVDFVAPPEYLGRAPQPPIYVFVIDVSVNAVANGLLATAARVIKDALDRIPNSDDRTRVSFIAVDGSLNFFHVPLPSQNEGEDEEEVEPNLIVVSDLDDPFLPRPDGLLVNLKESRAGIDRLLDQLGSIYANTVQSSCAIGSALQVAHKLLANVGGKIIVISASMPTVGIAKLDVRDDRKLLGTAKETSLFQPGHSFYKSFAVDCNRSQVSVDMFLFGAQYQDVASLSSLPKYTGGQTFLYAGWMSNRMSDVQKFANEFTNHLSMEIETEAVLRVRSTTGIRSVGYYGNAFIRSSDLMSYPTFPRDQSYVIEMSIDDPITKPYVLFQAALLHTTCYGERRIRVLNLAVPTASTLTAVYASADQLAITAYLTQKAVEKALSRGVVDAGEMLNAKMLEIFKVFKSDVLNTNAGTSGALQIGANMRMLPLLLSALRKHTGLKKSAHIMPDLRMAALSLLSTLPVKYLIKYLYPDFFALHDLGEEYGLVDENGLLIVPPKLNLTGERIESHGLYFLSDGQVIFLWIGRDAVPQLLLDAFGVDSLDSVDSGRVEVPELDTDLNIRIRNIIAAARSPIDKVYWPTVHIIKENTDPSLRMWATSMLVEDRTDVDPAYFQQLNAYREKLST